MAPGMRTDVKTFVRYPGSSVIVYNGTTVLHYLLGGWGILMGYGAITAPPKKAAPTPNPWGSVNP